MGELRQGHYQTLIFLCKTSTRGFSLSHVTQNPEIADSRVDSFNSLIMSGLLTMSAGFPWFSLNGHKMASIASNSITSHGRKVE